MPQAVCRARVTGAMFHRTCQSSPLLIAENMCGNWNGRRSGVFSPDNFISGRNHMITRYHMFTRYMVAGFDASALPATVALTQTPTANISLANIGPARASELAVIDSLRTLTKV